jgi:hypothetical protein
MVTEDRYGVAQVVLHGREQLVLLRPQENLPARQRKGHDVVPLIRKESQGSPSTSLWVVEVAAYRDHPQLAVRFAALLLGT